MARLSKADADLRIDLTSAENVTSPPAWVAGGFISRHGRSDWKAA